MALPFDVEFFLMDMRFEHDRSERLHKQEYEALHHDLYRRKIFSSVYQISPVPRQKCTILLPHQNYISGLLTQKSGFYSKAKKALAQMKYKPLESTAEACLKRKQAKSDNLAAE
ncbi:hypothetical protein NC653_005066 [Populus alba x Populus x berolinensis]|uniref:Uncharacterized protein n=1 Tax=Populus alba x Populus x berolinensis TaxID=444605 RepID=A0AAD6RC34_9ROSI|nr:hypothetical protein NC653_005066 [Populus alba x Populus x berolinensis]